MPATLDRKPKLQFARQTSPGLCDEPWKKHEYHEHHDWRGSRENWHLFIRQPRPVAPKTAVRDLFAVAEHLVGVSALRAYMELVVPLLFGSDPKAFLADLAGLLRDVDPNAMGEALIATANIDGNLFVTDSRRLFSQAIELGNLDLSESARDAIDLLEFNNGAL